MGNVGPKPRQARGRIDPESRCPAPWVTAPVQLSPYQWPKPQASDLQRQLSKCRHRAPRSIPVCSLAPTPQASLPAARPPCDHRQQAWHQAPSIPAPKRTSRCPNAPKSKLRGPCGPRSSREVSLLHWRPGPRGRSALPRARPAGPRRTARPADRTSDRRRWGECSRPRSRRHGLRQSALRSPGRGLSCCRNRLRDAANRTG